MKPVLPFAALPLGLLAATPALGQWTTDTLSEARWGLAATSVGTKAILAGGITSTGPSAVVDIYDSASGTWSTASLTIARGVLGATTVGTKALFAGGGNNIGAGPKIRVDIYDDATGMWTTATLSAPRTSLAATSVGTKALFGGGFWAAVVDIYDDSAGNWTTAQLSEQRGDLVATSVGTKALFAGGWNGTGASDVVDIYDDSTGNWTTATLSAPRDRLAAVTVGDLAIFAGGGTDLIGISDVVDIYDDSTGTWSTGTLAETREFLTATAIDDRAFFAGGYNGVANAESSTVDVYDDGGAGWSTDSLSVARWGLAATTVGSTAIFAGGESSDVVDLYGGGGSIGTNYCGLANLNSALLSAEISAFGSTSVADNFLQLTASKLPANKFGYFLNSQTQGFTAFPGGSQGDLCLGGSIGRHNDQIASSGGAGEFTVTIDLTQVPTPTGPVAVMAGETWNWTCWYRDNNPNPTSNFTDGIEISFQ